MNFELRQKLRAIGMQLTPDTIAATLQLLGPHALQPPGSVSIRRDLACGPHERHRLDIFLPDTSSLRPAILYVHGGGFTAGDKGAPGAPFYNNVGAWACNQGWVGITMNYRLAPMFQWPSGADDIERALDWLVAHAENLGIDFRRILLCGQSAGAAHVAGYVVRPRARQVLAGAIMVSGLYDLVNNETSPMEIAYYGSDRARYEEASTLQALAKRPVPCLYTVSELDPSKFQRQAAALVKAHLQADGFWPRLAYLAGHNHLSPMQLIGTRDDAAGPLVAEFAAEVFARNA
jgi:triacylglycerol lipase